MKKILIADDDPDVHRIMSMVVKKYGFQPVMVWDGIEAADSFRQDRPLVAILDLRMPNRDGMETLRELREVDPRVPVIMLTGHGDIPQAVEATKLGAFDFVSKPPDYEKLMLTVRCAIDQSALQQQVHALNAEMERSLEYLLGRGAEIRPVIHQIQQVARTDFSLILQGETGTGKSFVARMVHSLSHRAPGPFIAADIGSLPESLVESELFGHEKGAFTGADRRKTGYFEAAHKGTLFLDELQNIPPALQCKLLNAVEEKYIQPVGSVKKVAVDVRIIAATNTDLREAVREGRFREDLFYRLGEFLVSLPPLRERREDIVHFAQKFLREAAEDLNKTVTGIAPDAMAVLLGRRWDGNIRELKNVIRRAVLVADAAQVQPSHLVFLMEPVPVQLKNSDATAPAGLPSLSLVELEKIAIQQALHKSGGNRTRAAEILEIDYRTLLRKLKSAETTH